MNSNQHPAASYIERIVRLEEEKQEVAGSIRDIYAEAKEAGYTKGAIRIIVKRQLEDEDARLSREAIETEAEQIMAALGMLRDTPLGEAAVASAATKPDADRAGPPRRRGRPKKQNAAEKLIEDTPYERGASAARAGAEASANPYPQGGAENEAWRDGWMTESSAQRTHVNGSGAAPSYEDGEVIGEFDEDDEPTAAAEGDEDEIRADAE